MATLIGKGTALLWSLFLVIGPSIAIFKYVLGKVTSITTDMGTEIDLVKLPNLLESFMALLSGTPMEILQGSVFQTSRLLPNALPIGCWSHMHASFVKCACYAFGNYPTLLQEMRDLCGFFRTADYRDAIKKALPEDLADQRNQLKKFQGRFFKIRYETVAVVLSNLLKLSNMRRWLRDNLFQLFAKVKDKDMLRSVFAALGDNDLWVWMREFYRCIVWPLESSRRWGLICACAACQELRRQRKKATVHMGIPQA